MLGLLRPEGYYNTGSTWLFRFPPWIHDETAARQYFFDTIAPLLDMKRLAGSEIYECKNFYLYDRGQNKGRATYELEIFAEDDYSTVDELVYEWQAEHPYQEEREAGGYES